MPFICQKNYRKSPGQIFKKCAEGELKRLPKKSPLKFGVDPTHGLIMIADRTQTKPWRGCTLSVPFFLVLLQKNPEEEGITKHKTP